MPSFTYKTELEVVTDLLSDMTRKVQKQIRRLEADLAAGLGGPGQQRRVRVQIDLLGKQIEWYAKILAAYQEAERTANEYEPGASDRRRKPQETLP